jgi:hypothetical protein
MHTSTGVADKLRSPMGYVRGGGAKILFGVKKFLVVKKTNITILLID